MPYEQRLALRWDAPFSELLPRYRVQGEFLLVDQPLGGFDLQSFEDTTGQTYRCHVEVTHDSVLDPEFLQIAKSLP
jgi:hypothetical protein